MAPIAWEYWKVACNVCCTLTFLGIQDAGRKRKGVSNILEEWAGTKVKITKGETCLLVSHSKWDRVKSIILRIQEELRDKSCLNHK